MSSDDTSLIYPTYVTTYAINFAPYEFRIVYGQFHQVVAATSNGPVLSDNLNVVWMGTLNFSPAVVKHMSIMLNRSVEAYEKMYGPIHLHDDGVITQTDMTEPSSQNWKQ